jgi:hypothetical protein
MHGLQKLAVAMGVIVLSLAIFAAFWSRGAWPIYWPGGRDSYGLGHAGLGYTRSFNPESKGWLWRASDEGNDGRGGVPAYPPERLDDEENEL